jgi:light-regulated signal transduction histidine kinase (bacteriophytochrome)
MPLWATKDASILPEKPATRKRGSTALTSSGKKLRGRPITHLGPNDISSTIAPHRAKRYAAALYQRALRAECKRKKEAAQAEREKTMADAKAKLAQWEAEKEVLIEALHQRRKMLSDLCEQYGHLWNRAKAIPGALNGIEKVDEKEEVRGCLQEIHGNVVEGFRN